MAFAYKVGHDCEFFVLDSNRGHIVPVCGKLGGTKKKPLAVEGSRVGTTYQEDGVACEIGMDPTSVHDFIPAASQSFFDMQTVLESRQLQVAGGVCNTFKLEDLKLHPQALVIGCSPDYSAHDRGMKRNNLNIEAMGTRRFTGGHLHFSCPLKDRERLANDTPIWAVVQMIDALALMFSSRYSWEYQGERYEFYGLPGLYRPKPYGLEYRTPTNYWLWDSAGGGNKDATDFVNNCASVVQACSELSGDVVRGYYERIDWDSVKRLLDLSSKRSFKQRAATPEYARLFDLKEEMALQLGELR